MILIMVVIALALTLIASAFFLFHQAETSEKTEDIKSRLVVGGVDEAATSTVAITAIRNPVVRWICLLFWRTGTEVEPKTVGIMLLVIATLLVFVALVVNVIAAVAFGGGVALLFYMVLSQRASSRRIKIIDQLPAFLENVVRVLAAGNTFEESLIQSARESPDPIRPVFASITRQVRLGASIEIVLAEAGAIYRIRDLNVIALATSINRKYGGSMRSVLKSLITAIRQRGIAAKELRALTAETRFSAYTLATINIALFIFLFLSNRTYYNSMLATNLGTIMLGVSAGMVFLGMFVLWRMVKSVDEAD